MEIQIRKLAVCGALALATTIALAAVTFDVETGTGFVGKGDVQTPFGWNDHVLQSNATGVFFTYEATTNYEAVCTWTTGTGTPGQQTHNRTRTIGLGVNSTVASLARRNSQLQVTGFNLTGFSGTTFIGGGDLPVVGGACPGNQGNGAVWTSVTQVDGGGGGLYANYGTTLKALIWP